MELPTDHTTVASSEDQVYNLIRVACDEIAHASFEMTTSILQRASRLSGGGKIPDNYYPSFRAGRARAATPIPFVDGSSDYSDVHSSSSVAGRYTSGAMQTGENDLSLPSLSDVEGQDADLFGSLEASGSSQEQIPIALLRKQTIAETSQPIGCKRSTRTVGVSDPP